MFRIGNTLPNKVHEAFDNMLPNKVHETFDNTLLNKVHETLDNLDYRHHTLTHVKANR